MRLWHNDKWKIVTRDRNKAHQDKTKYGISKLKPEDPRLARKSNDIRLSNVYSKKDGSDLTYLMMNKTVMISKTIATLYESSIPKNVQNHLEILKANYRYYADINQVIPAYIIYDQKGAYEKALEILNNLGFTIIEGIEPKKKKYIPKDKTAPTYSLISPQYSSSWQSPNPNDQIKDPTHFYYATLSTIRNIYRSSDHPDHHLVNWFLQKNPKTVTITNIKTAESLEKMGAVALYKGIESWYNTVSQDKDRMTNVIRASRILSLITFTEEICHHPIMQSELGMKPVDPMDKDFWYESNGYNYISKSKYYLLRDLKNIVEKELEELWEKDPERQNIIAMCQRTNIFNKYAVSSLWSSTKPDDKDEMVDKIIAAMKLFG
jgi:hypothetical protein